MILVPVLPIAQISLYPSQVMLSSPSLPHNPLSSCQKKKTFGDRNVPILGAMCNPSWWSVPIGRDQNTAAFKSKEEDAFSPQGAEPGWENVAALHLLHHQSLMLSLCSSRNFSDGQEDDVAARAKPAIWLLPPAAFWKINFLSFLFLSILP